MNEIKTVSNMIQGISWAAAHPEKQGLWDKETEDKSIDSVINTIAKAMWEDNSGGIRMFANHLKRHLEENLPNLEKNCVTSKCTPKDLLTRVSSLLEDSGLKGASIEEENKKKVEAHPPSQLQQRSQAVHQVINSKGKVPSRTINEGESKEAESQKTPYGQRESIIRSLQDYINALQKLDKSGDNQEITRYLSIFSLHGVREILDKLSNYNRSHPSTLAMHKVNNESLDSVKRKLNRIVERFATTKKDILSIKKTFKEVVDIFQAAKAMMRHVSFDEIPQEGKAPEKKDPYTLRTACYQQIQKVIDFANNISSNEPDVIALQVALDNLRTHLITYQNILERGEKNLTSLDDCYKEVAALFTISNFISQGSNPNVYRHNLRDMILKLQDAQAILLSITFETIEESGIKENPYTIRNELIENLQTFIEKQENKGETLHPNSLSNIKQGLERLLKYNEQYKHTLAMGDVNKKLLKSALTKVLEKPLQYTPSDLINIMEDLRNTSFDELPELEAAKAQPDPYSYRSAFYKVIDRQISTFREPVAKQPTIQEIEDVLNLLSQYVITNQDSFVTGRENITFLNNCYFRLNMLKNYKKSPEIYKGEAIIEELKAIQSLILSITFETKEGRTVIPPSTKTKK